MRCQRLFSACLLLTVVLTTEAAVAADAFWDINGTGTGAGGATPEGTWNSANTNWNSNSGGTAATAAWVAGNRAYFAAGTDATGAYTVTVDGTQSIDNLDVQEGHVTLAGTNGGTLSDATNELVLTVYGNSSLTLAGTLSFNAIGFQKLQSGTLNIQTNFIPTGTKNAYLVGTINQTSGTVQWASSGWALRLNGNYNISGGTLQSVSGGMFKIGDTGTPGILTVSGTGLVDASTASFDLGYADATNTGIVNLDGGTIRVGASGINQRNGSGTFYLNGGVLQGSSNLSSSTGKQFFGSTLPTIVTTGGAVVDTAAMANAVSIQTVLEHDGALGLSPDGGLRKIGLGTLTLSAINTYTGDTKIEAGTLRINHAYLADTADVYLKTGATFDLNFTGTDAIRALFFDDVMQAAGTWGAPGSGAQHPSSFFTGTGLLQVIPIPEPSTLALLACAVLGLLAYAWRKRK